MSVSIVNIRPATSDEWDTIWQGCDYSTYFHSREWAEIWNVYTKGKMCPNPLLVEFSDGKKALIPLSCQKNYKGLLKKYISSPAETFGGWLSEDALSLSHGVLLVLYLTRKLKYVFLRMNPYNELMFSVGVKANQDDETQSLNLKKGFEAVLKGWTKGHKAAVTQARKKGVSVRVASSQKDWKDYYQVYEDSLRRWGDRASSFYDWAIFKEMFQRNSPWIKLWLAFYSDEVVSGALCFYSKRHVVYWHGASLDKFFLLRPNNLLIYEVIKDACEKSYAWFDFNPSGGHEGVKAFKRSFGAEVYSSNVFLKKPITKITIDGIIKYLKLVRKKDYEMFLKRKRLQFADEIGEYIVLKLKLSNYIGTNRTMIPETKIAHYSIRPKIRKDEKRLLKLYFRAWEIPYKGKLPGWRNDSPLYMLWNDQLVGGLYVCERNEFDSSDNRWGQLHYFFVDSMFRRKGLHSLLFSEGVRLAQSWGLEGVYISTDRYGLQEVYQRWGAVCWKKIPKSFKYPKHTNESCHNWLVYKIHDNVLAKLLKQYASGILVDIGCGEKPYVVMTNGLVKQHIGVDHAETEHDKTMINIFASAYDTTLPDASADTVLCTSVLEHLERPEDAIQEMYRILKPGGYVILSAPLLWHLHEEPRDFYRYTKYDIRYLFEKVGFEIVELKSLSGFWVTFGSEWNYYLESLTRGIFRYLLNPIIAFNNMIFFIFDKIDRRFHPNTEKWTWMCMVVARKH